MNQYSANLTWRPLATVDAAVTATRRDESERTTLLQSQDSVRMGVALQLLADLRYVTDLDVTLLDDPYAGRSRNSWTWTQTLEMRPLPSLDVAGTLALSRNETFAGEPLLERTQYQLWTTRNPTAYLSLSGSWWYTDDSGRGSLNQSYSVSYAPGDRPRAPWTAASGAATSQDS